MAAWGLGSFENDDALDVVAELATGGGPEGLERTLRAAIDAGADKGPDRRAGAQALAAAEIVAAALGKPCDGFPQDTARWLGKNSAAVAALAHLARGAVARVSDRGELASHWAAGDSRDAAGWKSAVADLASRLG